MNTVSSGLTVQCKVRFHHGRHGRKHMAVGNAPWPAPAVHSPSAPTLASLSTATGISRASSSRRCSGTGWRSPRYCGCDCADGLGRLCLTGQIVFLFLSRGLQRARKDGERRYAKRSSARTSVRRRQCRGSGLGADRSPQDARHLLHRHRRRAIDAVREPHGRIAPRRHRQCRRPRPRAPAEGSSANDHIEWHPTNSPLGFTSEALGSQMCCFAMKNIPRRCLASEIKRRLGPAPAVR